MEEPAKNKKGNKKTGGRTDLINLRAKIELRVKAEVVSKIRGGEGSNGEEIKGKRLGEGKTSTYQPDWARGRIYRASETKEGQFQLDKKGLEKRGRDRDFRQEKRSGKGVYFRPDQELELRIEGSLAVEAYEISLRTGEKKGQERRGT